MSMIDESRSRLALVTGATGYIGGRLVPELLAAGFRVRVLVRRPELLRDRPWVEDVDVAPGDAADEAALAAALAGVDVAYYLLHSLVEGDGFDRIEQEMAKGFGRQAKLARRWKDRVPGRVGTPSRHAVSPPGVSTASGRDPSWLWRSDRRA